MKVYLLENAGGVLSVARRPGGQCSREFGIDTRLFEACKADVDAEDFWSDGALPELYAALLDAVEIGPEAALEKIAEGNLASLCDEEGLMAELEAAMSAAVRVGRTRVVHVREERRVWPGSIYCGDDNHVSPWDEYLEGADPPI